MEEDHQHIDDLGPLSKREIAEIRRIIQQDQRAKWFWSTARVWALWITAIITAVSLTYDLFVKAIRRAAGIE